MPPETHETQLHPLNVMWIYPQNLAGKLDAATWLDTTHELGNLGCKVTLISVGAAGLHNIRGVSVLCIPAPSIYLLGQVIFHARVSYLLIKSWSNVDVIMFHQLSAFWMMLIRLLAPFLGKRRPYFVLDSRTLHMAAKDQSTLKDKLRGQFVALMNHLASYWVDGQLAITPRLAEALRIPDAQLWGCWPSGVDLGIFSAIVDSRHWPLPDDVINLIYIGSLNYERNLLTLCQAVQQANMCGFHFCLTLVGSGTEQADLNTFARQTTGWLRLLAPVPHNQVPDLLASAHVGVLAFPDRQEFRVSSPIKLFEYMAAGLPILATRIVCHTDVVGTAPYVFWAEGADQEALFASLQKIEASRHLLPAMSRVAVRAAESWTWEASSKKLRLALEHGSRQVANE